MPAGGEPPAKCARVEPREKVVLVTGGTGLVGSALQTVVATDPKAASEKWVFLSSNDGDLISRKAADAVFKKHKPTHVIHLAARQGGLFHNMARKVEVYRENVLLNDNVMECCRVNGVEKLVSCLPTCIFPATTTYPVDETMMHDGSPHSSDLGFSTSKRMIDVMNHCYDDQYKCKFTAIIPTNAYGPHDNFSIDEGHVIPALIHKCHRAKLYGESFVISGSGKPMRQFIHSDDLAKLAVWAMREYQEVDPVILSVDEKDEVSIKDVAEMVADAAGFTGRIIFDQSRADGQQKTTASNKKLRSYLPDYTFKPIRAGINESYSWFASNFATCRK